MKRIKYMLRGQAQRGKAGSERGMSKANIDAYFDLSCLKGMRRRG